MLRKLLTCSLALVCVATAHAGTIRIELDGSGDYPTIQDGINAAAPWDSVLVGPGTYTWSNQNTDQWPATFRGMIQFLNEAAEHQEDPRAGTANDIFIIGREGRQQTIIDGERRGRVIYASGRQTGENNVDMRFTIEGFTIQNGYAYDEQIETNRWGGGAATHLSSPTFRSVRFRWNEGQSSAGAAWTGGQNKALFDNCVFIENTAPYGAAVLVVNTTRNMSIWRNCRFESNVATRSGGGIYTANAAVTLEGCIFLYNDAKNEASAIATNMADPLIVRDCFIVGNTGGSVETSTLLAYYQEPGPPPGDPYPGKSTVEISHTLIASNSGKGILFHPNVDATVQCTIASGHSNGNWLSYAAPLRTINGNSSEDPHICTESNLRRRHVCEHSLALAINNPDCDQDIGRVVVGCSDCEAPPEEVTRMADAAYPNPFSDTATIDFSLARPTHMRIVVYDLRGRIVRTLHDGPMPAGPQIAQWDGEDQSGRSVASGYYLCQVESEILNLRTPMVLVR